ncbi:unnamed protein product [Hyaloperonospora brassicae]|uniref:RRM domain-containing protein n=1 Tax=Hyaloperonospora brassicae TaxID=162125 RepID=A0AAV0UYI3_HYABA|nr:unnamed protein product [Hyaloperonospora brassicae]
MGRKRVEDETDAALPALDPQPQLPWGMEKTEMQPSSLTSLTDDKLARFVLGHQKKTKFQKEREDREAKKRRADEEAAKIYATFVASFDNEGEAQGKTFVRSAAALGDGQSTHEHGETYRLEAKEAKAGLSAVFAEEKEPLKVSEMDQTGLELQFKEADKMQQSGKDLTQVQKPKKRRAIDEFLEEMKERGPAPVSLEGTGLAKGSFDDGNPETTNLYVGNLAPSVTEEVLEAEFGRYGDVYSVKIMWPRSEEERARKRNCGFVSFYERRDADDARVNLDNKELEGQPMIVGWGKAVAIQPRKHALEVPLPPVVALPSATDTTAVSAVKQTVAAQQTITVEMPTEETRWCVDHLARSAAVKNASLFRTTFQECLPEVMHKLRCVHKNIGGRMSANAMKEKVMNVLSAWESWSLFPPAVLLGLHATFLRKTEEEEYLAARNLNVEGIGEADLERLRKTCRQSGVLSTGDAKQLVARLQWLKEFTSPTTSIDPGQAVATKKLSAHSSDEVVTLGVSMSRADTAIARRMEGVDRETAEVDGKVSDEVAVGGEVLVDGGRTVDGRARVDGKPMDAEELDGEPFDEDVDEGKLADEGDLDGEPLDEDADEGEPVSEEDLDGEPLDEDADVGEPVDEEDLDGEPLDVDVGGPDSELFGGDVNEVELDGEPLDSDDLDGVPMDGGLDAGSM